MKVNTENTKLGRLQLIFGSVLSLVGVMVLIGLGAFYGYSNAVVWISGFLLVISGILIACNHKLSQLLTDILRI